MVALDILSSLFTSVWGLFTGTMVPGLGVSCASLFIAIMIARFSILFIRYVLGFGGSGTGYRSGSSRNPKISNDRKGDEF